MSVHPTPRASTVRDVNLTTGAMMSGLVVNHVIVIIWAPTTNSVTQSPASVIAAISTQGGNVICVHPICLVSLSVLHVAAMWMVLRATCVTLRRGIATVMPAETVFVRLVSLLILSIGTSLRGVISL